MVHIDQLDFPADLSNKWHFQNFHRSTWRFLSPKASSLLGTLGSTTWPGRNVWPLGKPSPPPSFCPSVSWAWAISLVLTTQTFLLVPVSAENPYFPFAPVRSFIPLCCQLGFFNLVCCGNEFLACGAQNVQTNIRTFSGHQCSCCDDIYSCKVGPVTLPWRDQWKFLNKRITTNSVQIIPVKTMEHPKLGKSFSVAPWLFKYCLVLVVITQIWIKGIWERGNYSTWCAVNQLLLISLDLSNF